VTSLRPSAPTVLHKSGLLTRRWTIWVNAADPSAGSEPTPYQPCQRKVGALRASRRAKSSISTPGEDHAVVEAEFGAAVLEVLQAIAEAEQGRVHIFAAAFVD
jgi:hypothetical protein